jgi:MFS family permease
MSFILLMGIVSLVSDITHEGAASILGDYLSMAGASAAAIGFASGLGECVGYSLRLVTGYIADKTKKYWPMTVIGYLIDCLAVPALALVPNGGWLLACILLVVQRTGKAIKKPAKDTIMSFAASKEGAGKSFAIQELLDQIGAFLGPVMLFLILLVNQSDDSFHKYSVSFALLGIPAVATILLLLFARRKFPNPEQFEPEVKPKEQVKKNRAFVLYIVAIFCLRWIHRFYADHHAYGPHAAFAETTLPLLYAGAMITDAAAALLFGWLYDKYGIRVLMLSMLMAAPFAILIFGVSSRWALYAGVALWGVGMGAQESVLKAAVTSIVPKQSRASGFGVFQTAFGISWFIGSWLMGSLYDVSMTGMVAFSVAAQLLAIPLIWLCDKKTPRGMLDTQSA